MVLLVEREPLHDCTPGKLYINDEFLCDTIEDMDRGLMQDTPLVDIQQIKIPDETCIPYGTYEVIMTYSPKFGKVMPQIMNVPGFDGIRLHGAHDINSVSGCVGLGEKVPDKEGVLCNGPSYTVKVTDLCTAADIKSEYIEITIRKKK